MRSRLIGFYSYKGGVGRSMALAHCACELAARGRKVLIVDWDLEAPGQHCTGLFHSQYVGGRGPKRGFLDFASAYRDRATGGLPDLATFVDGSDIDLAAMHSSFKARGKDASINSGMVHLLAAGSLSDMNAYRGLLQAFSWADALDHGGGFGLLRHLRSEFERLGYNDVLIDARTGDSDPFYVVAVELADILVFVSGYNRQNLAGTAAQWNLLLSYPKQKQPGRTVLVGSPMPSDGNKESWLNTVRPLFPALPEFEIELPYQSRLVFEEEILSFAIDASSNEYVLRIQRLVDAFDRPAPTLTREARPRTNPFSVPRADYASNKELLRYFVDPGEAITRSLAEFMPVMVYGNRGTGKTTLAKHHDHQSALDHLDRTAVADDLPQRVGLYLRFDIDLLNSFNTRDDVLRRTYNQLFANFFDILVVRKALSALDAFGGVPAWCDEERLFKRLLFEFGEDAPATNSLTYGGFCEYVERHFSRIRRFLNDPQEAAAPFRLQGNILLKLLVEALIGDPRQSFGERWFAVLVDEVEHFEEYQQRTLNSRIKQIKQSDRVTYRYFLRHEGLRTKQTAADADQIIQESHDFRTLYLDSGVAPAEFQHHAKSVAQRQLELNPGFGSLRLRDIEGLFAALSPEEEAVEIVRGSRRSDQLLKAVAERQPKAMDAYAAWSQREPSVLRRTVAAILLNQGKSIEHVVHEFSEGTARSKDWYHNYHRSALYWLCNLYRKDKTYAGLEQVLLLSGGNLRYFLEYCRAIVEEWTVVIGQGEAVLPIPVDVQDAAIRKRAQFYIDDLRGKPKYAEQMLNLVKRLGAVFQLAHRSPRQSQFEVNHFSIAEYDPIRQKELASWLRESRMENVLLRRPGNKQKSLSDDRLDDWVLHPCFAPYFNISMRRKKKLDGLLAADLQVLFNGTEPQWMPLFASFEKRFDAMPVDEDAQEQLFGDDGLA